MVSVAEAKRTAVVQSNYIPWKGYFDLINLVDDFVLFDDVQYTRRDWRNRNVIKTPSGLKWLCAQDQPFAAIELERPARCVLAGYLVNADA
jgi:hypothetical protein